MSLSIGFNRTVAYDLLEGVNAHAVFPLFLRALLPPPKIFYSPKHVPNSNGDVITSSTDWFHEVLRLLCSYYIQINALDLCLSAFGRYCHNVCLFVPKLNYIYPCISKALLATAAFGRAMSQFMFAVNTARQGEKRSGRSHKGKHVSTFTSPGLFRGTVPQCPTEKKKQLEDKRKPISI